MIRYWKRVVIAWAVLVAVAVTVAWRSTRPAYDARAVGAIVEARKVYGQYRGVQTFSYEHTVTFKTPDAEMTVVFSAKLPTPVGAPIDVAYNSANPAEHEFYDDRAFGHALQLIAGAVLLVTAFGALAFYLERRRGRPMGSD